MKKILITGANSYIGTSFEAYLRQWPEQYQVDTVDMIDGTWREKSFSGYDSVFHVAGIAHQKETKKNAPIYYKINRELAVETAQKAKNDGVGQFIFLSSMSVYGMEVGTITKQTIPAPKSNYGKSKLYAEDDLKQLANEKFKLCILRPPMVYGDGCRGNYQTIVKIIEKSPIFPYVNNQRSLIHIDNLISFVRLAVDRDLSGLYFPQNRSYMNTRLLAKEIACEKNKRVYFSYAAGAAVLLFRPIVPLLKKAFGNLIYKDTEEFDFEYCQYNG